MAASSRVSRAHFIDPAETALDPALVARDGERAVKAVPYEGAGARDSRRAAAAGFTLIELFATMTIVLLLTAVALPVARVQVQRQREVELRRGLREMRLAINQYKDFSDRGLIPVKADTLGYPPDLDTLVKGVALSGMATGNYKFLRRIPVDPMAGTKDWGLRSMQDDPDSTSWGGQNVFDVFTRGTGKALDGTNYADW